MNEKPPHRNPGQKLKNSVEKQVKRMEQADKNRRTILAQSVYLEVLGLVFVLPVIVGAYLGHWIDSLVVGYSVRWTLSLILLGLVIGAINVYLLIRE